MIDSRFSFEQLDYGPEAFEMDGHSELNVVSTVDPNQPAPHGHTMLQVNSAANHSAGILARVALTVQPLIDELARVHDCRYVEGDKLESVCSLHTYGIGIGDATSDRGADLLLIVPTTEARSWTVRLAGLLTQAGG